MRLARIGGSGTAILLVCAIAGAAPVYFGNHKIQREFDTTPAWRTVEISCPLDGWTLTTHSDELKVEILGGPTVQGSDWQLLSVPQQAAKNKERRLTVCLGTDKAPGLQAEITYAVREGEGWLRKAVRLSGPKGLVVSRVDLEPMTLTPAPRNHSGKGMPILIGGRCWFGVEYPASRNRIEAGRLELVHFPGREVGGKGLACKTAVCGVARPGQALAMAFEEYLNTVALPPRHFLHYNSWYDLRGAELTPTRLLETYEGFRKGLMEPYGVELDSVVIDDGWQERRSIWRPRKDIYPQGFGPLARDLEAQGTRLGLWMPLSGFNLDVAWGTRKGYEKSSVGNWYCLGGRRFYSAMRDAAARLIREGNLNYYKHDFNFLSCQAEGHDHLPTSQHGHETNVDRTLELLKYEREIQPGIFLNVTSGMWFSPWWLMYADSIWGNFPGDTGYERSFPQLTPREWEMSFRDVHLYRMYARQPNNLFPLSRLMTHGITQGRYNMLGGQNEPVREWTDHVIMYFGRGVLLQELYLTPERMREDLWRALGTTVKWAKAREAILTRVQMIGGDPAQGQPYGFIHWQGRKGVWVLRNPSPEQARLAVAISQTTGYLGGPEELHGAITYPYLAPLPEPVVPGKECEVALPPASVVVVEVRPESWGKPALEPAADARGRGTVTASGGTLRMSLSGEIRAREAQNTRLYVVLRQGATGKVNIVCEAATGRRSASGAGWQLEVLEINPSQKRMQAMVDLPSGRDKPFASRRGKVEAWLVYEVRAEPTQIEKPPADLPWAIGEGWRRRSLKLLDCKLPLEGRVQEMTPEQFGEIAAARLHLEVFGVNGSQYADKWILLNGTRLGRVPLNDQGNLDQWEEKTIELTPEQVKTLKSENALVFTNETGDCYKVRNLALAVQLRDGTWVESEWDEGIYCSVDNWLHTEGRVFEGGKSPSIILRLRLRTK